ncbi:hypothetical protein GGP41_008336 [Bipolaris sorokiniana]|uniref:Uncharacterized protein n=1 Tax=Cochliobolus sativus TaxID=45130 RepID=A0A8H6E004_COCSA|nr:hypothetical protein GGP41_008336 [Bipolaris sorokiniana]
MIIIVELLSGLHGKCEKLATNISRNSAITRKLDARRRARAQAKLDPEAAAHWIARQAAHKRLQKAIKISRIGKKPSSKRRAKLVLKNIIIGSSSGGAQPADRSAAPPLPRSRLGRPIKLPIKYQ